MARTHRARRLRRSLEQHVDGLETDCCLTADGELVLLHDPLLELGTTLSGWAHRAHRGADQGGEAASARRRSKRGASASARRAARARAARRDAPARGQGPRRPRARAAHHPSDLRPTRPPPRAGTHRDPQLLHDRMRARRRPGLPDTADHHRRLPHRRARHLGANSGAARRLRRALPPLARAGRHLASVRAQRQYRHHQPPRAARGAAAAGARRHHQRHSGRAAGGARRQRGAGAGAGRALAA